MPTELQEEFEEWNQSSDRALILVDQWLATEENPMAGVFDDIANPAEKAVTVSQYLDVGVLDYSEASLAVVEEILAEMEQWVDELTPEQLTTLVQDFGCYILEVGRRQFGGRYLWHDGREQPVLVVGEPVFRIAMITWDKVRRRVGGDSGDNIPFFCDGFAGRVRKATPGEDALVV